jgi:opacity protein-like surface antigen
MIGKFAASSTLKLAAFNLLVTFILFAHSAAQSQASQNSPQPQTGNPASAPQTSAGQQPATGQQPAEEEESTSRRKRAQYQKWQFNVSAGVNTTGGTTKDFVRGGAFTTMAGAARNANRYLGLRLDFMYANLPLRATALELAQATGATNYALSATLDPIINIPASKDWGLYILFGPAFTHRHGSLDNDTTPPGSPCTAFWRWYSGCLNASVPLNGNFVNPTQNDWGYNFGAGISRKVPSGVEIYAEYRFMHGSNHGVTTDFRPITIGFRW